MHLFYLLKILMLVVNVHNFIAYVSVHCQPFEAGLFGTS